MALIACFGMVLKRALQNTPTFPLHTISADPVQQRGREGGEPKQSGNCQPLSVVGMLLSTGTGTNCIRVNETSQSVSTLTRHSVQLRAETIQSYYHVYF